MDRITLDQLRQTFSDRHSGWCVSLFMPTHRAGRETEQDPIRFKNLLRQAEERLQAKDQRSAQVRQLLKTPQHLLQDQAFWRHQSDGLAVFFSEDIFQYFRLPVKFAELAIISDRFHVKPLLPFFTSDSTFFILALSQNEIRLLEGTQHTVDEIELKGVPRNLSDSLPEGSPEKHLQFHTGAPSRAGNRPAMFHGHDTSNEVKNRIRQWFRMIDRHIRSTLPAGRFPLVLAGVDALFPLYKEINTCPHLMDQGIAGNPAGIRPEELHQKAWAIIEPVLTKNREAASARYRQLAGTGQTATTVAEVVPAAHHGRIEALFVAVGVEIWGRFDSQHDSVDVHEPAEPGDEDLLDLAAIQTLINEGTVHAVSPGEVPDHANLAAVFRY